MIKIQNYLRLRKLEFEYYLEFDAWNLEFKLCGRYYGWNGGGCKVFNTTKLGNRDHTLISLIK